MVSSVMPAITSFIGAMSRSPSRISTSWFSMKSFGWPASEGICAICELPPGPWHAVQAASRCRWRLLRRHGAGKQKK